MVPPKISIIISPRDRFAVTQESLESLYANTPEDFELVYVDTNSPKPIGDYLAEEARQRGFQLIRTSYFMGSNASRNLGLRHIRLDTDYVVFAENDVVFAKGWLSRLIECAEATGAGAVSPLICQGLPLHTFIHYAGGEIASVDRVGEFFDEKAVGTREIHDRVYRQMQRVEDCKSELKRTETQLCEWHCVLLRRDLVSQLAPFDEGLIAQFEHVDLALNILKAGSSVWLEPTSIVTYVFPVRKSPLVMADWPFFFIRWSDTWQRRSWDHMTKKWGLRETPYQRDRMAYTSWRREWATIRPKLYGVPFLGKSDVFIRAGLKALRPFECAANTALVKYAEARGWAKPT